MTDQDASEHGISSTAELNSMTLQVGMVGTDGIVLASDRLIQRIEQGARSIGKVSKFIASREVVCCYSGDLLAERIANRIPSIEWSEQDADTRAVLKDIAVKTYMETEEEFGSLDRGIVRKVIVAVRSRELWLVDVSQQPFANKILDRVVAGDSPNTCRYFLNKFANDCYLKMKMNQMIGIASHCVLSSGEENPYGVDGLEVVAIPFGKSPVFLTREHEDKLKQRFHETTDRIATDLMRSFEY